MPGDIGQSPQYPGTPIFPDDTTGQNVVINPNTGGAQSAPALTAGDLLQEFMAGDLVGGGLPGVGF